MGAPMGFGGAPYSRDLSKIFRTNYDGIISMYNRKYYKGKNKHALHLEPSDVISNRNKHP